MNNLATKLTNRTTATKVDDAVGLLNGETREWFVAIVNNRSEKKCSQVLERKGYQVFLPIQQERHIWKNGTKKTVDRILIAATIFVCCTEKERMEIVNMPFVKRFMVDHTKRRIDGRFPIAKIPAYQVESFRKYIDGTDEPIEIEPIPYKLGDKVKIVKGKFEGIEGNVIQLTDGEAYLIIGIGLLGCAKLKIDLKYLTHNKNG